MSRANSRVMMYQQQHAQQEKELKAKREAAAAAAAAAAAKAQVIEASAKSAPEASAKATAVITVKAPDPVAQAATQDPENHGLEWLKTQIAVKGPMESWTKRDIVVAIESTPAIDLSGWRLSKLLKAELIALVSRELEDGE
jgi:hypothetical protein